MGKLWDGRKEYIWMILCIYKRKSIAFPEETFVWFCKSVVFPQETYFFLLKYCIFQEKLHLFANILHSLIHFLSFSQIIVFSKEMLYSFQNASRFLKTLWILFVFPRFFCILLQKYDFLKETLVLLFFSFPKKHVLFFRIIAALTKWCVSQVLCSPKKMYVRFQKYSTPPSNFIFYIFWKDIKLIQETAFCCCW